MRLISKVISNDLASNYQVRVWTPGDPSFLELNETVLFQFSFTLIGTRSNDIKLFCG